MKKKSTKAPAIMSMAVAAVAAAPQLLFLADLQCATNASEAAENSKDVLKCESTVAAPSPIDRIQRGFLQPMVALILDLAPNPAACAFQRVESVVGHRLPLV